MRALRLMLVRSAHILRPFEISRRGSNLFLQATLNVLRL